MNHEETFFKFSIPFFDGAIESGMNLIKHQDELGIAKAVLGSDREKLIPGKTVHAEILRAFRTIGVFAPRQSAIQYYVHARAQATDLVICNRLATQTLLTQDFMDYRNKTVLSKAGERLSLDNVVEWDSLKVFRENHLDGTHPRKFHRAWILYSRNFMEPETTFKEDLYDIIAPLMTDDAVVIRMN